MATTTFHSSPCGSIFLAAVIRNTTALALLCLVAQFPFAFYYHHQVGYDAATNVLFHALSLCFVLKVCYRGKITTARRVLTLVYVSFIVNATLIWQINLGIQLFLLFGIFTSSFFYRRSERIEQTLVMFVFVATFLLLDIHFLWPLDNWQNAIKLGNSITLLSASLLVLFFLQRYTYQRWHQLKSLHDNTRTMLRSLLPRVSAQSTEVWPPGKCERLVNVSVLFADLQGYTSLSQVYDDDEVVAILDALYQQFDDVAVTLGVEKLKTNGDEYMAATGIPFFNQPNCDSVGEQAFTMCEYAVRIRDTAQHLCRSLRVSCDIRIGIATGAVTAGIIGKNKPVFDIWGKTVNLASRLEQGAAPGSINICRATRQQLTVAQRTRLQLAAVDRQHTIYDIGWRSS